MTIEEADQAAAKKSPYLYNPQPVNPTVNPVGVDYRRFRKGN